MLETKGGEHRVLRYEWRREQLRYRVLDWVHQRTGGDCGITVTGTEIGSALQLAYEELYRVIHFLENSGYLNYRGAGPRVCITDKGIRYLREDAQKRRSVRG